VWRAGFQPFACIFVTLGMWSQSSTTALNATVGAILHFLSYEAGRPIAMDLNARMVAVIAVSTGSRSIDDAPTNPTAAHRPRT